MLHTYTSNQEIITNIKLYEIIKKPSDLWCNEASDKLF